MKSSHVLAICVVTALVLGSTSFIEAQEVRFDYTDGEYGPANWGNYPGWETCGTGTAQSPMIITPNITVTDNKLDNKLRTDYPKDPFNTTISNDGHTIEIAVEEFFLTINDVTYESAQMHFHYPSEHTINGKRFALELHLVHIAPDTNAIAVVGWLFDLGDASPFLAQFIDDLPTYIPGEEAEEFPLDNFRFTLSPDGEYGRYQGSLTTPPCTEGVTWTLRLGNHPTVSTEQINKFKAKFETNARPEQAPNGRKFFVTKK